MSYDGIADRRDSHPFARVKTSSLSTAGAAARPVFVVFRGRPRRRRRRWRRSRALSLLSRLRARRTTVSCRRGRGHAGGPGGRVRAGRAQVVVDVVTQTSVGGGQRSRRARCDTPREKSTRRASSSAPRARGWRPRRTSDFKRRRGGRFDSPNHQTHLPTYPSVCGHFKSFLLNINDSSTNYPG